MAFSCAARSRRELHRRKQLPKLHRDREKKRLKEDGVNQKIRGPELPIRMTAAAPSTQATDVEMETRDVRLAGGD
jgi:hypothetical protein